ncbi:hypothetical protein T484DRAFT_1644206, partial [Baffinella frigidus]
TLNPTPETLHPKPSTLHPTPYTLHPAPCTLNPTPSTLHPQPYTLASTLTPPGWTQARHQARNRRDRACGEAPRQACCRVFAEAPKRCYIRVCAEAQKRRCSNPTLCRCRAPRGARRSP